MTKKLITLALAALMLLSLAAPAMAANDPLNPFPDGFVSIFDGTLSSYDGPGGDVVIPDKFTRIEIGAFQNNESVKTVTIPASITRIGGFAFVGCTNLTDVYFGGTQEQWEKMEKTAFEADMFSIFGSSEYGTTKPNIHYNSTGPSGSTTPETPTTPTTPTTPETPTTPTTPSFSDVSADAYYAAPVAWAVEKGITNGTSKDTFSPDKTCNNAEILTFLWRACGKPEAPAASLTDVSSGSWYADAASWAKSKGMISGDKLSPETPCTRASAVMFIWQAMGKPAASKTASFSDVPADSDYADAVAWAVEKGVTNGTGADTFSPDNICTRGHIVTFLQRAFAE